MLSLLPKGLTLCGMKNKLRLGAERVKEASFECKVELWSTSLFLGNGVLPLWDTSHSWRGDC